jgi:uncharacterized NAD(P)/FAD-binding protein YdhS
MALRVAVVGGGFAGAAFAIHLIRLASTPVVVQMIEQRATPGLGLAYDSTDPAHRLNNPAAPLSTLYLDQPQHLHDWLEQSGALAADPDMATPRGRFPRRAIYGAYVAEQLSQHAQRPHAEVHHIRARARSLTRDAGGWRVTHEGGGVVEADAVVLATGHPPAAIPGPLAAALAGDARLVPDPWVPGALDGIGPQEDVLIVGTGLTMADIVTSLSATGHRGRIVAVSRRGLKPLGNPIRPPTPWAGFGHDLPRTALGLLRMVRGAARAAMAAGEPWQRISAAVHSSGHEAWAILPLVEQRRFLRHLGSFYSAHRFRMGPQVQQAVEGALTSGRLEVIAGHVRGVEADDVGVSVMLAPARAPVGMLLRRRVDRVVIATGPAPGATIAANPFLAAARDAALLRQDALGVGIDVDRNSQVLDVAGRPQPGLYVVGPPARGIFGDLVGVPDIVRQAQTVAAHLLSAG